jgi:putative transposase
MPWDPEKPYHPPHHYADSLFYFITARTFDRRRVWRSDVAKRIFLAELRSAVLDYGVPLYAWAILREHYHVLVYIEQRSQLVSFIKRLHGASAIQINKRERTPGRKVWYNYWDYCPRDDRDFYRVFNYIHIQPVRHGVLMTPDVLSPGLADAYTLSAGGVPELHELLGQHEFTSYCYYARKYGLDTMVNVWLDYPIPRSWEGDAF